MSHQPSTGELARDPPAGDLALPERAMDLAVSPEGRWVIVASTICPVDGALVPGVGVPADMPEYEVQIQVFHADDPAVPGRLLTTTSTRNATDTQCRRTVTAEIS